MSAALAGLAGLGAGAHTLFGYNRANYLYDRKMRLEQEFKVIEYRNMQANLWREDVRDIIGLTERRMDSYLVVNTLQLGMCVGLFTEGRLEPGTPPWLMHLYMLTLGAGFMYLLMSVWLALHAMVVAQSSSVRLLTQFVRLPIPTWEQLEAARTYGSNFEELGVKHMLRVPFVGAKEGARESHVRAVQEELRSGRSDEESSMRSLASSEEPGAKPAKSVDPWNLEGHTTDIYELLRNPTQLRHHIDLARQASKYYQCYDAFARVSMCFGTNQLLHAITYYALGYCSVMDRAPWPAWCVAAIMCGIAAALIELDMIMSKLQRLVAQALVFTGPICASCAACAWTKRLPGAQKLVLFVLPLAYATHGIWLFFALRLTKIERQSNGSFMPTKFRPVLYLDIFGWMTRSQNSDDSKEEGSELRGRGYQAMRQTEPDSYESSHSSVAPSASRDDSLANASTAVTAQRSESSEPAVDVGRLVEMREALDSDVALWISDDVNNVIDEAGRSRAQKLAERYALARAASGGFPSDRETSSDGGDTSLRSRAEPEPEAQSEKWLNIRGHTDYGQEVRYLYNPATTEIHHVDSNAPSSSRKLARSLTECEQDVDRFCAAADTLRERAGKAEGDKTTAANEVSAVSAEEPPPNSREAKRLAALKALEWLNEDSDPLYLWGMGEGSDQADTGTTASNSAATMAAGFLGFRSGSRPGGSTKAVEPEIDASKALGGGPTSEDYFDIEATFPRVEGEELMPGHRRLQPGRIPYTVFRSATLLLSFLWILGVLLPLGLFSSLLQLEGIYVVPEQIGGELVNGPSPISEDAAIAEEMERLHMTTIPSLPQGELVQVTWPSHSGFQPRALSCDERCQQLVVSDDFGVYSAALKAGGEWTSIEDSRRLQLRGAGELGPAAAIQAPEPSQTLSAHFERVPPCAALEGQQLKDLGVVCTESGGHSLCRILVLHSRGRSLTECSFFKFGQPGLAASSLEASIGQADADPVTWKITGGWLHRKGESVQSVAVNNDCFHSRETLAGTSSAFEPDRVGCVVVGTSQGRVVQLRRHLTNSRTLVPERAVQQRGSAVPSGSLHVVSGGFVMALRPTHSTLQALDGVTGNLVGEWRLPRGVHWKTLCGGGDSLYMLGYEQDDGPHAEAKLWRFDVPPELRVRHAGGDQALMPIGRDAEM